MLNKMKKTLFYTKIYYNNLKVKKMNKFFESKFTLITIILLCFLSNWYKDNISLIFYIIIRLILIILCMYFFYKLYKKSFTLKNKIITSFIFIITLFLFFYDFRLTKTKIELNIFKNQRNIIIQKIKNNEFKYYYKNNIKLSKYKYTSNDGEIYVYKNDTEGQVISFWIYRGLMSDSIQLIYTTDKDLLEKNIKNINKSIKLNKNWFYITTK